MSLRTRIVDTARHMVSSGLVHGTSGNVSARLGDGMLITPSGRAYDTMAAEEIVEMGPSGKWQGKLRPSSEWRFHQDIYAARPEIHAIVHAHPVSATALAVHGMGIGAFHYMVAIAGGRDIRCADYATFGTQELSDAVVAALKDRKSCLMAHHGMIACGADLGEALQIAEEVELLAAQYIAARTLGEPPLLSDAQMDEVMKKFRAGDGYGSSPAASSK